jgi:hypothetical protein
MIKNMEHFELGQKFWEDLHPNDKIVDFDGGEFNFENLRYHIDYNKWAAFVELLQCRDIDYMGLHKIAEQYKANNQFDELNSFYEGYVHEMSKSLTEDYLKTLL